MIGDLDQILIQGFLWINWLILIVMFFVVLTWPPVRGKGLLATAYGIAVLSGLGHRMLGLLIRYGNQGGAFDFGGDFWRIFEIGSLFLWAITLLASGLHLVALFILKGSIMPIEQGMPAPYATPQTASPYQPPYAPPPYSAPAQQPPYQAPNPPPPPTAAAPPPHQHDPSSPNEGT